MPRTRLSPRAVTAALATLGVLSCRDPTEVTLDIGTDQACGVVDGVTITVGAPGAVAGQAASAVTRDCTPGGSGGRFGTVVVTPSGGKDAAFVVQVVASIGVPVETCAQGAASRAPGTGCIVARRALSFIPHTPLVLPIEMRKNCLNVECDPDATCFDGRCVTATLPQPETCATPGGCDALDAGADATVPSDGGSPDSGDAATNDAAVDAGPCLRAHPPPACHPPGQGVTCSYGGNTSITCATAGLPVCCAGTREMNCQPASGCSGATASLEYEFDCDEQEDCPADQYCIATAIAGPGGGARCQVPALACSGVQLCRDSCDCDADVTCSPVACNAALGGMTMRVTMSSCGGLCP